MADKYILLNGTYQNTLPDNEPLSREMAEGTARRFVEDGKCATVYLAKLVAKVSREPAPITLKEME